MKVSKSIENVALWGNGDFFEKDVLKCFYEALKTNKSVKVMNIARRNKYKMILATAPER